jgi:pantothenate kinase type III
MLLVVDVGNTNTVLGVYLERPHQHRRLTSGSHPSDELGLALLTFLKQPE